MARMIGPNGGKTVQHKTNRHWECRKRVDQEVSPEKRHGILTATARRNLEVTLQKILDFYSESPNENQNIAAKMIRALTGKGKINPSKHRDLYELAQETYSEIGAGILPCY